MNVDARGALRAALFAVAVGPWAVPVAAQDHSAMHMPMPATTPAGNKPQGKKPAAAPIVHETHGDHMAIPPGTATPAAGQGQPEGMHDMQGMQHPIQTAAPATPRTPIPELTDADRVAAQPPRDGHHPEHDNSIQHYTLIDRLEISDADPGTHLEWQGRTWIGTDLNRLWLRSEGERSGGVLHGADMEVLYGRSIATWWDVVIGGRHDFKPGASQDFAAIGIIGTAPYKIELQATAYIGQGGQASARIEAEYQALLTNRLVLQPLVEVNLYAKDDARRGVGAGLSTVEAGLRLRYEITRRFAPYIGLVRERAFGETAGLRRAGGDAAQDTRFVAGLRVWF